MHDGKLQGHGYFVGYDKLAKAKIGYIGCDGFRPDEPPFDRQFPVDGRRMSRRYSYGGTSMIDCYYDRLHEVSYLLADDGLRADQREEANRDAAAKGHRPDFGCDVRQAGLGRRDGVAGVEARANPAVADAGSGHRLDRRRQGDRVIIRCRRNSARTSFSGFALPGGKVLVYRDIFGDAELSWLDTPAARPSGASTSNWLNQRESEFMEERDGVGGGSKPRADRRIHRLLSLGAGGVPRVLDVFGMP